LTTSCSSLSLHDASSDLGIFFLLDLAGAVQEKPIGHLHDVGFMEYGDSLPLPLRGIAECESRDTRAGNLAGDLHARHHAGNNLRSEEHTSELQSLRHLVC